MIEIDLPAGTDMVRFDHPAALCQIAVVIDGKVCPLVHLNDDDFKTHKRELRGLDAGRPLWYRHTGFLIELWPIPDTNMRLRSTQL